MHSVSAAQASIYEFSISLLFLEKGVLENEALHKDVI